MLTSAKSRRLLVPSGELLVGANRGGAGGKTQYAIGLEDNLGRDDIGGLTAHILIVFCFINYHNKISPYSIVFLFLNISIYIINEFSSKIA